jgi:hypothetical protein
MNGLCLSKEVKSRTGAADANDFQYCLLQDIGRHALRSWQCMWPVSESTPAPAEIAAFITLRRHANPI